MVQYPRYYCQIVDPTTQTVVFSCYTSTFEEMANLIEPYLKRFNISRLSVNTLSNILYKRYPICTKKQYSYYDYIKIYPISQVNLQILPQQGAVLV